MIDIQRKEPKQIRSKVAVKSILEATTRILLAKGMKDLTTNHIAELAGVSIGSLYQYFPNKEAIIVKLIEQHIEKEIIRVSAVMTKISKNVLDTNNDLVSETNIRLLIKETIDVHAENLELTRILYMQVNHVVCCQALRKATHFFTKLVQNLLNQDRRFTHKNNYHRAYIVTNSVDLLIQTTLIEQPQLLTKQKFLNELVDLCMSYLVEPYEFLKVD